MSLFDTNELKVGELNAWYIAKNVSKQTVSASYFRKAKLTVSYEDIDLSYFDEISHLVIKIKRDSVKKLVIKEEGLSFFVPFITPLGAGILRGVFVALMIVVGLVFSGSDSHLVKVALFTVPISTVTTLIASLQFIPFSRLMAVTITTHGLTEASFWMKPRYKAKLDELFKDIAEEIESI